MTLSILFLAFAAFKLSLDLFELIFELLYFLVRELSDVVSNNDVEYMTRSKSKNEGAGAWAGA